MKITVSRQIHYVADKRLNDIEHELRQERGEIKNFDYRFKPKKLTRWQPCKCKVCGEVAYMMTNHHAQSHGYEDAEAMMKVGAFENIFEFKGEY